jgi:chromosome segregation ATPase
VPTTLADLEARVAALEAERADYRAVLTAVNALGENQRELAGQVRDLRADHGEQLRALSRDLTDTNARVRSIEERLAEMQDLLVRALDR